MVIYIWVNKYIISCSTSSSTRYWHDYRTIIHGKSRTRSRHLLLLYPIPVLHHTASKEPNSIYHVISQVHCFLLCLLSAEEKEIRFHAKTRHSKKAEDRTHPHSFLQHYLISWGVISIHWDPCANAKSTRVSRLIFRLTASWIIS